MPAFELGYNLPSLLYFCRSGTIKKIYGKMAAVFRLIILPAFELGNIFLQVKNVGPPLVVIFLPLWDNKQFLFNGASRYKVLLSFGVSRVGACVEHALK